MIFVLLVNLYVSRIVLKSLGVEDYGLYSVVGSVVSFLGFLNTSMSSAAQRFLSFAQGQGDENKLNSIFNSIFFVQIILAIFVLIIFETIGIFYINHYLNVDSSKIPDAHIVFQFSVASFVVNIITVPYNAAIIANERMDIFALYSVFEVILKLGIAFLLPYSPINTLIYYSVLMFALVFFVQGLSRWFCRRHYAECKIRRGTLNKVTVREILSYAGWNLFGTFSGVVAHQGVNMILNSFFGVVVNAARGISFQVNGAMTQLYTNFQQAINPQIVKSYAANELQRFYFLITQGTRLAFFLLFVCALPVMFNMKEILNLWLDEVPEFTTMFCVLTVINSLIGTMSQSLLRGAMATGRIRNYQIIVSFILMLNLPLSYIGLQIYKDPYLTIYIMIALSLAAFLARLILLHYMTALSIPFFLRRAVLPISVSVIVSTIIAIGVDNILPATGNIYRMVVRLVFMLILCLGVTVILGMRNSERRIVFNFVKKKIRW